MLIVCSGAKGGSGTSVVAAALALASSRPATLLDLAGDAPGVLGLDPPAGPGIADWLTTTVGTEALADLGVLVGHVTVIPRGSTDPRRDLVAPHGSADRWSQLVAWATGEPGAMVVDAGCGAPPDPLVEHADRWLLVTRPCYLALVRAARARRRPHGVVVVDEPGRALTWRDVQRAVGAPVVARIPFDPAVARAVDAGLLAARRPRLLDRRLGPLVTPARWAA